MSAAAVIARPEAAGGPAGDLPAMMDFADVRVGPQPFEASPGADWPDFDRQHHARLLRRGRPVCRKPVFADASAEVVDEPAAFVCFHHLHFGHFVAEAVPRLPQTLVERPGLPLVFTAQRPLGPETASAPVRAVLDWMGVAPARLRFVHRPTLFRRLSVAAQGEHLDGPPPGEGYLRLLEAFAARHDLPRPGQGTVYVGRSQLQWHKGAHAGEAHLEGCLAALGVQVIRPEAMPLAEQLRAYAGAGRLIFAEGSALHGRQLLGRIDQDVSVLVRRPGATLGRDALLARVRSLAHAEVVGATLHALTPKGAPRGFMALAFYDLPALFAHFDWLGLPLRRVWDQAAYERARDLQVLRWLKAQRWHVGPAQQDHPPAFFLEQVQALGLGHLAADARRVLDGGPVA